MSGPLIGAIDEGTSSARFILFNANTFEVVCSHQKEIGRQFPREGWVEQDPIEIWEAVCACIDATINQLEAMGGRVDDIVTVGVTNQRESVVAWNRRTGVPLYNCIVWMDMRTTSTVDQLLDKVPNGTRNKNYLKPLCGLPISPYFSAVKYRWLIENVPTVKKAVSDGVCAFGTVDSWLIWNLTNQNGDALHITDVTNASRTMLMNIETLRWDPILTKFFDIRIDLLPKIKSSSEIYGSIKCGKLKDKVTISGCLGDQHAALIGQNCTERGQAKVTYGTGCFLLYNIGNVKIDSHSGLITTVAYQLGATAKPVYALEGSVAMGGAMFDWLRDNLSILPDRQLTEMMTREAASIADGRVVFVPAFSGLYAPHWRQDARGVIVGITEDTNANHLVQAASEAICFQVRDIVGAMNNDYQGGSIQELKVDGGVTQNAFLMQLQADLAGVTVVAPDAVESTALGVARVAAAAVNYWKPDGKQKTKTESRKWTPTIDDDKRDYLYSKWQMAIETAVGWDV